jgi:two-component system LytT family response regulator
MAMRAFLVDDEALALKRLDRMLAATNRVQVIASSTDPVSAIPAILDAKPDVLFLDIEMPWNPSPGLFSPPPTIVTR